MIDKLKSILKEVDDIYLRKKIDQIVAGDKLIDDLGMDSLGRVSLFHEINFELDVDGNESKATSWVSVEDVLNYMEDPS